THGTAVAGHPVRFQALPPRDDATSLRAAADRWFRVRRRALRDRGTARPRRRGGARALDQRSAHARCPRPLVAADGGRSASTCSARAATTLGACGAAGARAYPGLVARATM